MTSKTRKKRSVTRKTANPKQTQDMGSGFWEKIEADFYGCEAMLSGASVPSLKDVRQLQAAIKTKGKKATAEVFETGLKLTPLSKNTFLDFVTTFRALDVHIPQELQGEIPEHLFPSQKKSARQIVLRAISKKAISTKFILAWGQYKQAVGIFAMFLDDKRVEDHYKRNIKKNLPNILEKHIYAYWLERYFLSGKMNKVEAEEKLESQIYDLENIKGLPNDEIKALQNMMAVDESGLKTTYKNLSMVEIKQILEEKVLSINSLIFFN